MIDKNLESRYAEHYFAWADKETFIFNLLGGHFPRVYVSFKPTQKMCKLHNSCSPVTVAVHPYAAPAFQMVFEDLYEYADQMRTPDGSPFILEPGDLFTPLSSLHCLSDSPVGADVVMAHVMTSQKPDCLSSIGLGLYNKSCYTAGDHGAKCPHGIDYHSYGVGIYVKEGENPSVSQSEASGLEQTGDLHQLPEALIATFKRYGFEWGGDTIGDGVLVQPARFTLKTKPDLIWRAASKGPPLPPWGTGQSMAKPATTVMEYCAKRFTKQDASKIFKLK